MDGNGFDDLTRRLATGRSRRSVLRGIVGGGAALAAARAGTSLAAPEPKVDVCHWDAAAGAFVWLSISQNSWLTGHQGQHAQDYLRGNGCCTAGECGTDSACLIHQCAAGTCAETSYASDCVYTEWSAWGECSAACGGGTQTRSRQIVSPAVCGGLACDESTLLEQQGCNAHDCDPECDPGYEPSDDGCVACSPGTYSDTGAACLPCPAGTSAVYSGQVSCDNCACDGLCDAITGECAGGGGVGVGGECSADGDCEFGHCGCNTPPGFAPCICRAEICVPEGGDCTGGPGAVLCCSGDCVLSGGVGTCIANICDPPCPAGQNCAFGTICL